MAIKIRSAGVWSSRHWSPGGDTEPVWESPEAVFRRAGCSGNRQLASGTPAKQLKFDPSQMH